MSPPRPVTLDPSTTCPASNRSERRNEFADNVSWIKGKHTFKFGVRYRQHRRLQLLHPEPQRQLQLSHRQRLRAGLQRQHRRRQELELLLAGLRRPHCGRHASPNYGFYVQDQWRVTPKLTATTASRYEYSQLPQPTAFNPIYPQTCHINSPRNDFMPRIGLAYRLDNKTVLRAGYGMFYARIAGATLAGPVHRQWRYLPDFPGRHASGAVGGRPGFPEHSGRCSHRRHRLGAQHSVRRSQLEDSLLRARHLGPGTRSWATTSPLPLPTSGAAACICTAFAT